MATSYEEIFNKFHMDAEVFPSNMEEAKEMMNDPELKELAETEMLEAKEKLPKIEEELKILLIPKDPDDDKNIICEIRAGAGGEEAALFAGTLFRMYGMYAERKHWQIESMHHILDVTYDEDRCKLLTQRAQENLNILKVFILRKL